MTTNSIRNQIKRLLEDLPDPGVDSLPIVTIHPDRWPASAAAAYWAADDANDDEERRRIIREQTGQEVSRCPGRVNLITIRVAPRAEAEIVG